MYNCSSPCWNETIARPLVFAEGDAPQRDRWLRLSVHDYDAVYEHRFIGAVTINVGPMIAAAVVENRASLFEGWESLSVGDKAATGEANRTSRIKIIIEARPRRGVDGQLAVGPAAPSASHGSMPVRLLRSLAHRSLTSVHHLHPHHAGGPHLGRSAVGPKALRLPEVWAARAGPETAEEESADRAAASHAFHPKVADVIHGEPSHHALSGHVLSGHAWEPCAPSVLGGGLITAPVVRGARPGPRSAATAEARKSLIAADGSGAGPRGREGSCVIKGLGSWEQSLYGADMLAALADAARPRATEALLERAAAEQAEGARELEALRARVRALADLAARAAPAPALPAPPPAPALSEADAAALIEALPALAALPRADAALARLLAAAGVSQARLSTARARAGAGGAAAGARSPERGTYGTPPRARLRPLPAALPERRSLLSP
jgi:hypothetical protein